jgi:hypothetical protein
MGILQAGRVLFDDGAKLGDSGVKFGDQSPFPAYNEGNRVWTYTVPGGKKATLQNIVLAVGPGVSTGLPGLAIVNLGTFYLVVDGSTKLEMRLHGAPLYSGAQLGPMTVMWDSKRRLPFEMGDGIDFASGQVIRITHDPVAVGDAFAASKLDCRLYGVDVVTGVPIFAHSVYRPVSVAAGQVALEYTAPANGFRLLSFGVSAYNAEPILAIFQVFINRVCIFESGPIAMSSQSPSLDFLPYRGTLSLPMEGMELNAGDFVELYAHAWIDVNQIAGGMLVGDLSDVGGGGGLAARVIGSPVVRRITQ